VPDVIDTYLPLLSDRGSNPRGVGDPPTPRAVAAAHRMSFPQVLVIAGVLCAIHQEAAKRDERSICIWTSGPHVRGVTRSAALLHVKDAVVHAHDYMELAVNRQLC
jgi:hypothetical protein